MNLNTTSFFNSTEVNISSRMNEYMKKNFGYEVEGDIATLREARKSLQAEQHELKDNYMSAKYVENMLMIETITSLLKAHGETLKEDEEEPRDQDGMYDSGRDYEVDQYIDKQKSTTKVSMAKLKAGDEVQILAKGPGAERNGLKRGENPYGEGNTVQILGFGVVPFEAKTSNKSHVIADSLVDFKDLYKKEIRNLKSDEDYERDLRQRDNSRARLNIIVNDIVPKPGFVGFIYQSSSGPGLMYISRSLSGDKWAVNFGDDMEFDLVIGGASQSESLEQPDQIESVKEKGTGRNTPSDNNPETVKEDDDFKYDSSNKGRYDGSHPDDDFDDEEKGAEHYRWKNESQLAVALGRIESAMEEIDHAIEYRGENSAKFFNNGDKAGVGSLMSIKGTLQKILDNWEKDTEFYGM